ncbi:rhodanese-like domain-containing protein [Thiomicrorhabdus indica]|uniref:rhodanese-like domain-containing protein n=1 Tax=Thiomicrorhabdus indica TaxID=2267253 RepID=UPI002AA66796|nr:rhodanese-like domain-containing protein [Thiomicrorhabdus indica]
MRTIREFDAQILLNPPSSPQNSMAAKTFIAVSVLAILMAFSQIVSAKGVSPETVSGATTIAPDEAKKLWRQGVKFIDTRKSSDWEAGRIPGALHINIKTEFDKENLLKQVDVNEPVVTYCNAIKCKRAANAAKKLVDYGYQKVYYYRLGFPSWKNAGYPYE